MPKLFDDNCDSDVEIKTDNKYATQYNTWREKEELYKLKTKYGDPTNLNIEESDDDSSSSEDDEDGKLLTENFEKDFFKTLSYLKSKDPKIYDDNVIFFDKKNEEQNPTEAKKKKKKQEPMFMKDYERKMILEKGAKFEDSEEETEDLRAKSPTYVEEQQRIKESLKKAVEDDENDEENWGGIFKKREKTKEETEQEEEDYRKWLKGNKEHLENKNVEQDLKSLKDFWNKPDLDNSEKFLKDYILNKRYLERENDNHIPTYEEIIHDSEDEENINKQEEFEHKYNFRYEEPDQEFIKRYPRTMQNSVRKTDDRRKLKRVEIKQRKEEEKKQKQEELKQLKILKRKEIEEKIKKIKEITGNEEMAFNELDLEADFDPEEHDKKMEKLFSEDYYCGEEGENKPEFSDFEEELGPWKDQNVLHCEDENFNMDCDYDPEAAKTEKSKKDKKKRNRKRKSSDEKEEIDETVKNTDKYEEYMDEIYKLDYEDIIDDIPCRFKYREVVANDFGLSIEEILLAKDKELNRWCSLKKTTQYRPEEEEKYDVIAFRRKGENEMLKKKYLPSIYDENLEEEKRNAEENDEKQNENVEKENDDEGIKSEESKRKKNKYDRKEEKIMNVSTEEKSERKEKNKNIDESINVDKGKIVNDSTEEKSEQKKNKNVEKEKIINKSTEEKLKRKTKKKIKNEEKIIEDNKQNIDETIKNDSNERLEENKLKNNVTIFKESKCKKSKKDKHKDEENEYIKHKKLKKQKKNKNNKQEINKNTNSETKEQKKLSRRQKKNFRELQKKVATGLINTETKDNKNRKRKLSLNESTNNNPKKRKLNKLKTKTSENDKISISDARLQAYGINPKKYRNKLKYKNKINVQ